MNKIFAVCVDGAGWQEEVAPVVFGFRNPVVWFLQQGPPNSPDFIIKKIENIAPITPMRVLWCNFEKPFLFIQCGMNEWFTASV